MGSRITPFVWSDLLSGELGGRTCGSRTRPATSPGRTRRATWSAILLHLRAAERLGLRRDRGRRWRSHRAATRRWPRRRSPDGSIGRIDVYVPTWMDDAFGRRLDDLGARIRRCERRDGDPPGDPAMLRFREARRRPERSRSPCRDPRTRCVSTADAPSGGRSPSRRRPPAAPLTGSSSRSAAERSLRAWAPGSARPCDSTPSRPRDARRWPTAWARLDGGRTAGALLAAGDAPVDRTRTRPPTASSTTRRTTGSPMSMRWSKRWAADRRARSPTSCGRTSSRRRRGFGVSATGSAGSRRAPRRSVAELRPATTSPSSCPASPASDALLVTVMVRSGSVTRNNALRTCRRLRPPMARWWDDRIGRRRLRRRR